MDLFSLLFPLLILLLFIPIVLSGRRQRRQMQEMKDLQAALEPGDVIMTTSGLRATVVDASYEETIDLEIADGVVTTWVRAAVREKVDPTPEEVTEGTTDVGTPGTTGTTGTTGVADAGTTDDHANGNPRT